VPPRTGATLADRYEFADASEKKPKAKNKKSNSLPQAIPSNRFDDIGILTDGGGTANLDRGMRRATLIKNQRQVSPNMPTLPEENGHDGNNRSPIGDLLGNSSRQIRRHEFEKCQRNGARGHPAQILQPRGQPLKRLSPSSISSAVRKQHNPMRSHNEQPRRAEKADKKT